MPLQLFGDFGLSAGFDQPADPYQNSQLCINYYPEISPSQTAKEPVALLGSPGLIGLVSSIVSNPEIHKVDWQGNQLQYSTPRTNYLLYSNSVGGTDWASPGSTVTLNDISAPDGTSTATLLTDTATTANHGVIQFITSSTTQILGSCFVKAGSLQYASIQCNLSTGGIYCYYTLTGAGSVSQAPQVYGGALLTGAYGEITALSGGWYKISLFANIVSGNTSITFYPQLQHAATGPGYYTGTGTGTIYMWGAQFEISAAPTSLIPTTSTPVTVTDYSISGDNATFSTAPAVGSSIYQFSASGDSKELGAGDGVTTTFALYLNYNPVPTLGTSWAKPYTGTAVPVRGLWVLPGRTQAIAIIGSGCYIVTYTQSDTSVLPTLSLGNSVGTLLTTGGQVRIRDNGLGGVAVIVDGPNGYYYVYGTAGSAVGPVGTFVQITDTNFLGSFSVAFIDGWWIFQQPFTQKFYTNSAPYSTTFDASYYAYKDSFSDNLVAVMESKEELWLLGEQTTEIWYDAGGQYFPFQRLVGTLLQVGCKAPYSVARFSAGGQDGLIWLGRSDRGENVVVKTSGFNAEVVSTPAVSNAITQLTYQEDAFGYTYQDDGHEFYVLTFPTADVTWVYDGTLPPAMAWHQRPSYDPYAQQFHRNRSNAYMQFAGMRIVGDYQNGTLYQLTRNAYSDAAWPLIAIRRSPFVWDQSRTRVFTASLQVDFAPGVGNNSGTWTNPQAQLRTSKDYGTTFGQPRLAALGKTGNYLNRCMWRQLGFSRATVAEIQVIDPVKRDIVGATIRSMDETAMGNL